MGVLIERYLLAILAGLSVLLIAVNPLKFTPAQRISCLIGILALAVFFSWLIGRLNKKKAAAPTFTLALAPVGTLLAVPEVQEKRVFVPQHPQDLMNLYENRTHIQADKLAATYEGKWMRVSGKVVNISQVHDTVMVSLKEDRISGQLSNLHLRFSESWLQQLEILPHGHNITAIGQIYEIGLFSLKLKNCELVDAAAK